MQISSSSFQPPNPLIRLAVRKVLSGAMLSGAVIATFGLDTAQAQQAPSATPSDSSTLTEVVVTGSRIKQPELEAVSPVVSVTSEQLQQAGTPRIEDILNQLPQVVGDMGSALANGATGAATVSLRGLGCQRTLVLVNGRRLMPGDPTSGGTSCADLNQIPSDLVERVDLLTGGASAVYGADAVAGVVNFVMNDHFEGAQFIANDGFYNHSQHNGGAVTDLDNAGFNVPTGSTTDGQTADFTAILGSNFDDGKGNATAYLGYRHTDPVLQGSRDYSACSLTSSGPSRVCGGSGTTFPTRFSLNGNGYVGSYSVGPGGSLVKTSTLPAGGLFNYAPLNYFQRPDDRYTGGAFAHYDVNDHARVYLEFQFMDDRTYAQIAPSGAFTGSGLATTGGIPNGAWAINCSNPYLSTAEYGAFGCTGPAATNPNIVDVTFGRRNVEGGNRTDDLGHTSYRSVLGVKGDINDTWSYDTYFQNGVTRFSEEYTNDVSKLSMSNALQAVKSPTGQIICAANAVSNNAPGCVPWNIFQPGGVTPAALAYISVPGEQKGYTQELVWEGDLTGDLGKMGIQSPWASNGLGVSVGADWRQEKAQLQPDEEFITNDLAGQGSPTLPTYGAFTVWEGYTEARMPLMTDQPFAKSLDVEAGYRYSDYSLSFGSTNTWKAGIEWAPVQDARLRAGYNVSVRAPNIQELYLQQRVQLDGTSDPCASSAPGVAPAASAAQCANSGVTAAEYGNIVKNPANQYNGLEGGNPDLKPETARTSTFGIVLTPQVLPQFNATVDYYDIKIKNVIGTYGANLILSSCVNSANPLFCSLVHRAPATGTASDGSLWLGTQGYITDATYNLGELQQQGIDFEMNYRQDLAFAGKLDFNLSGNYDLHFRTTPYVGAGTYDCAGYYGPSCGADGGVSPHIKTVFRINYSTPVPGLDFWAKWRLIGPVKVQNLSQNPLLAGPVDPIEGIGNSVPGFNYIDLGASYQLMKQVAVRFGVNNVADKDPPIIQAFYGTSVLDSGNTYPQTYDWGGRYLFANLTITF
jgi:outer membrane receptor protein involved in Fe transport